jgi:hypothetical protein
VATSTRTGDVVRGAALGAAAAAQVLVPLVGPRLAGTREGAERYDTVITPPGYAFAIWGPIFAGCVANAVQHALPDRRAAAANRASGWPLAGAYALNAAWSVAAQADRFGLTPALLPGAAGLAATAYRRLQRTPARGLAAVAPASTGLLLGWTGLAATVNLFADARRRGADPGSPATVAAAAAGVALVATGAAAAVSRSRQGFLPLAAAVAWGLGTTAATPHRPRVVRLVAGLGASAAVAAAAGRARRRQL